MQLLRSKGTSNGSGESAVVVEDSQWAVVGADDEVPAAETVPLALSLSRYLAEPRLLDGRQAAWTLVIEPADELVDLPAELLSPLLDRAEILVSFPAFTDGRGYSHAATLRQHYGYTGDLTAIGDIRRDQLDFMQQCGFTGFEITGNDSVEDMRASLDELRMPDSHRLYSGAAV